MSGWISIYRSIKDHWIWDNPIKFQWWIDLLLTVNHTDSKVNIGNTLIECKKGQTIKSLTNLAKQWNCSRDTARNFLELLKADGMVKTENLKKTTRITICKYDSYQLELRTKQTQPKRNPNAKQTLSDTNNKENKVNKENKNNKEYIEPIFLDVWNKWLDYKKELKNCYKTYKGEKTAYNKLIKLASNNIATAELIINQSIENEWKGLFEFKGTIQEYNPEVNTDLYLIPNGDKFGFSQDQLIDRCKQGKYSLK